MQNNNKIMLTENDVIDKVTEYLIKDNYEIKQALRTTQPGIDIIAHKDNEYLYIEAKGETSSRTGSTGKAFDKNQIKVHIAMSIFASIKALDNSKLEGKNKKVAIALPNNPDHQKIISELEKTLKKLGIGVFWVNKDNVINN